MGYMQYHLWKAPDAFPKCGEKCENSGCFARTPLPTLSISAKIVDDNEQPDIFREKQLQKEGQYYKRTIHTPHLCHLWKNNTKALWIYIRTRGESSIFIRLYSDSNNGENYKRSCQWIKVDCAAFPWTVYFVAWPTPTHFYTWSGNANQFAALFTFIRKAWRAFHNKL